MVYECRGACVPGDFGCIKHVSKCVYIYTFNVYVYMYMHVIIHVYISLYIYIYTSLSPVGLLMQRLPQPASRCCVA